MLKRIFLMNLIAIFLFTACSLDQPAVSDNPPADLSPVMGEPPEGQWLTLSPGMEWRVYKQGNVEMLAVRIDPALHEFRAHYAPSEVKRLRDWFDAFPQAAVVINANFYDEQNRAIGLVVTDGTVHGQSFVDRGGSFIVQDGLTDVRSNIYDPLAGIVIDQAVQAWPMLVRNGEPTFNTAGRPARRSAIGEDRAGRVVLLATARGSISLADFSAYLAELDLDLWDAFNLDGGGSTMLGVKLGDQLYRVDSFDPVPVVLAVYPRQ